MKKYSERKYVTDRTSPLFDDDLFNRTCKQKKSYSTPNYAEFEIEVLEKNNPGLHLSYYKCPYCGNFHLTEVL